MQVLEKICLIIYNQLEGDFVKKKDLFEQNTVLYNRLQTVSAELKKYKELYAQNIAEINSLRKTLAEMETNMQVADKVSQLAENKVLENKAEYSSPVVEVPKLEPVAEYGAEIIGKIVLEGTKLSNLFAENNNSFSVDLINLVLGKTEVCKSSIYDICHSEKDETEKRQLIDSIYNECIDYFGGLTKQV